MNGLFICGAGYAGVDGVNSNSLTMSRRSSAETLLGSPGAGPAPYRSFGYGHSFGVLSHYYGREAGVELREDIKTELQPGMVVSMEPMIMIPEGQPGAGGYREHDILVIRDDSVTNITGYPYGPEHNIITA